MSDTEKTQDSSGDQEQEKNLPLSEWSKIMLSAIDDPKPWDFGKDIK